MGEGHGHGGECHGQEHGDGHGHEVGRGEHHMNEGHGHGHGHEYPGATAYGAYQVPLATAVPVAYATTASCDAYAYPVPAKAVSYVPGDLSESCPCCTRDVYSTQFGAAEWCAPINPLEHWATSTASFYPPAEPATTYATRAVLTEFMCPSCRKGGFSTLQSAAECCYGRLAT
jgi:hypothetical protein